MEVGGREGGRCLCLLGERVYPAGERPGTGGAQVGPGIGSGAGCMRRHRRCPEGRGQEGPEVLAGAGDSVWAGPGLQGAPCPVTEVTTPRGSPARRIHPLPPTKASLETGVNRVRAQESHGPWLRQQEGVRGCSGLGDPP